MSKILLLKPRAIGLPSWSITQPIGIAYIGATLKKAGHETKIYDCATGRNYLHILKRAIKNWKPDFIGISIIATELIQTKIIMAMIREIVPNIPVTFGGPWPSANPEESIKKFGADFVVIGEGELVFPQLIDAVNNNLPTESIPGTASLFNGKMKINQGRYFTEDELNALPFPAWDLLNHKIYSKRHSLASVGCRPYMAIVTSRGCPFKCSYCHQTMGKVFRKRSAESVLAEMEELRFNYGFKEFEIIDDCFNLDRKRMQAILTGIPNRLGKVKLHFPSGLRADALEVEDMALFKKAGTVSAGFAIETCTPRLQKMIHKNLDIEKAVRTINASVKVGIYSVGFFMLGFPTETYEEASNTVYFAVRSSLHRAIFTLVTPSAGTELAEMAADVMINRNKISMLCYGNYFDLANSVNISAMSDDELHTIFRNAYRRFFLNPRRILGLIIRHPNFFSLPLYSLRMLIIVLRRRHNNIN